MYKWMWYLRCKLCKYEGTKCYHLVLYNNNWKSKLDSINKVWFFISSDQDTPAAPYAQDYYDYYVSNNVSA